VISSHSFACKAAPRTKAFCSASQSLQISYCHCFKTIYTGQYPSQPETLYVASASRSGASFAWKSVREGAIGAGKTGIVPNGTVPERIATD
jgi:hypothetical protein